MYLKNDICFQLNINSNADDYSIIYYKQYTRYTIQCIIYSELYTLQYIHKSIHRDNTTLYPYLNSMCYTHAGTYQ